MKKKKIRKLKVSRLIIAVIFIVFIGTLFWYLFDTKIESVYIDGNYLLNERDILKQADIDDYPSFCLTSKVLIRKRLLKNDLIKDVSVKKHFLSNRIDIIIEEYLPLFVKKESNMLVLSNKKEIDYDDIMISVPVLVNYIPDTKYDSFIESMSLIVPDVLNKISEIEYLPNEYDKERFLLYMADTNQVYLTLTKFDKINNYDAIILKLDGSRGTLYLDSGNHFQKY